MRRGMVLLVAVALVAGACAESTTERGDPGPGAGSDPEPSAFVTADVDRISPPADAPVDDIVAGIAAFGSALHHAAAGDGGGNVVLSPASIAWAFAMARAGADGATADQLDAVFGFPGGVGLHDAIAALAAALDGAAGEEGVLEVVQAAWAQHGFPIGEEFLAVLAGHYGAGVHLADIAADPEGVQDEVDAWVAEQTRDRIEELPLIDPSTRFALVNAVYLNAKWAQPFREDLTRDEDFHRLDGSTVEVPLMHQSELRAPAVVADDHVAVEIPYRDEELAMVVVVPDEGRFGEVEGRVDGRFLADVRDAMGSTTVDLALPRWDFETDLELLGPLGELGLDDLTGFGGINPALFLDAAVHAANITVDEQGTEAAAATGLAFTDSAPVPGEVVVRADRPFLFWIVHVDTGLPLFQGRVTDPSAG